MRLYLPFSDWFGTKQMSVWFQINLKMVRTIWFRFELIRFGEYLPALGITQYVTDGRLKMSPRSSQIFCLDWKAAIAVQYWWSLMFPGLSGIWNTRRNRLFFTIQTTIKIVKYKPNCILLLNSAQFKINPKMVNTIWYGLMWHE